MWDVWLSRPAGPVPSCRTRKSKQHAIPALTCWATIVLRFALRSLQLTCGLSRIPIVIGHCPSRALVIFDTACSACETP